MRRPAAIGLTAFAVVLALFVVVAAVPFVTKKRDQPASITSPPALESVSLVIVKPHQRACMPQLAMDSHARQARFKIGTFGKPGPRLAVSITPGGDTVIAPGWADNSTLTAPVDPGGHDRLATACIADEGNVKIALYAASDRAQSRALAVVDGKRGDASPQFGFWEAGPVSIATRAPVTVERIATFRGFLSHAWIVWIALALFLVGVPCGLGWLAWRAS